MAPKKTKTEPAEELATEATAPVTEETAEAVEETAVEAPQPLNEEEEKKEHFRFMRELVPVTPAPPRMGEDPNYPIGINGKLWLLPKGKTSMVPRYVADAFNQAEAAKGTQIENQAQLIKQQSGPELDLSGLTAAQIAQLKQLLGI
jgi:hypothetical protein